ncbi:MAG TPA: YcjF family protein, partial [Cyanophyceae cyanobacterium]
SLSRLYGLPMTSFEAGKLWKRIVVSSGGLLLGELGSSMLLGLGKSASAVASTVDSPSGLTAFAGSAIAQAGIAGYGAYTIGQAAQVYLEQGCTWGAQGPSTVIQDILNQVEPDTILYRLRQELEQQLAGK